MAKDSGAAAAPGSKRQLEETSLDDAEEDINAKRRRILEETRDIDADSETRSDEDSSEDDRSVSGILPLDHKPDDRASDDDEDETAELQRELEKIKRERAEKREQEVSTEALLQAIANVNAGERECSGRRGCQRT
jgi:protein CWC15